MNKKRKGYVILENIIALSLIIIMTSLVGTVFSTSVLNLKNTYKKDKMINLANKEMAIIEYEIKHSNDEDIIKSSEKNIDGFNIKSCITKKYDYYNCYKISVRIKNNKKQIELNNYVVKI